MSVPIPPIAGPIRVALLGCGRISRNHLDAIAKVKELELVSVADVDLTRAQAVGAAYGVPSFGSLEEMLAQVPSHLVTICSRPGFIRSTASSRRGQGAMCSPKSRWRFRSSPQTSS